MNKGLDSVTASHLLDCIIAHEERQGMRLGDYVQLRNGELRRVAHIWPDTVQLTTSLTGGSFQLGKCGVSYSGGLEPGVPLQDIIPSRWNNSTGNIGGTFWVCERGILQAECAVYVTVQCRYFVQK
jgi:hypothetical protein